jgi:phosphoenolpyruvate carboxylase
MGGDRDGNPFVTPETTRDVVITARLSAVNLFFTAIEQLMFELSNWRCSKEMKVRTVNRDETPFTMFKTVFPVFHSPIWNPTIVS